MARLTAKVGKRTKIKYDEEGNKIGGGTLVTQEIQDAADRDEAQNVRIKEDNTKAIKKAINQALAAALEEVGLKAERYAKLATPVDTGRLRNSITHAIEMKEKAVYIGTNVEYAPYVENDTNVGGRHREGVHMLRNAATQHAEEYKAVFEKHLDKGKG